MIALAPGTKVYLACKPVSMQKGFDGLTALASQVLNADPYSGHLFLFRGCGSAWKKDPGSGVIGVEKGPLIPVV